MQNVKSPDRPAPFVLGWLYKDTEPPISDAEFALFTRFRESVGYAPGEIAHTFACPRDVNRKTRAAVRRFVQDPQFPRVLELLERAKADALAEEQLEAARAEAHRVQEALASIDATHDNQLTEIRYEVGQFQHLIGGTSMEQASLRITQESYSDFKKHQRAMNLNLSSQGGGRGAAVFGTLASLENNLRDSSNARRTAGVLSKLVIRRSLVSMTDAERATLRMADVLLALRILNDDDLLRIVVPIVWNDGNCAIDFDGTHSEFRVRAAMLETLKPLLTSGLGTSAGAKENLNQAVRAALDPAGKLLADHRQVIERYLYSGNRWMSEAEGPRAPARDGTSPSALRIGGFPGTDTDFLYDQRESLVTVAPSGSGKSQAHVLRNLLYMTAPALVLDVKGEMLGKTRDWRERNVGKTYVFSPQDADASICYNPLDGIGDDPDVAWEDARKLADLLVTPSTSDTNGQYFESRARDMITTALLDVALSRKGTKRSMASVLGLLYMSDDDEILKWCSRLEKRKNTQLALQASALKGMPVKQRESIFDSARRQIEIWQSPAIARISQKTTFDAAVLRNEKATLYLAVALEDIKKYSSVLRVIIGQTLLKLYREKPESGALPVTFFLDELPRLGRMDVIEESLDVGRGYGVRLWLFCQNFGQLRTTYPNAQGMMSNCALRCFMNPDEDAARWLSENLGTRQGLLDGARKPLVEPHQLTGAEFAHQMVVFSRGAPPARLNKKPAYADPACLRRIDGGEESEAAETKAVPAAYEPASQPTVTEPEPPPSPIDWGELKLNAPAPLSAACDPAPRYRWRLAFGAACLVFLFAIGELAMQWSELRGLRAQNASLAAARDASTRSNLSLSNERARLANTLRQAESARDLARKDAEDTRAELTRERSARAADQQRLASLQRDLDTERTSPAAIAQPPLTAPAPSQPVVAAQPSQLPPPAAQGAATECDLLAANPNDQRRVASGVKFGDLRKNSAAAIQACDEALAAHPDEQRLTYQRARALYAANDPRARPLFDQLMAASYPSAFDNAAQYLMRESRMPEAEALLRRGVSLQDADAMVTLADAIRAGTMAARTPGEDMTLYRQAAQLGHEGAKNVVEQQDAAGTFINQASSFLRTLQH